MDERKKIHNDQSVHYVNGRNLIEFYTKIFLISSNYSQTFYDVILCHIYPLAKNTISIISLYINNVDYGFCGIS